jgi:competence protein ComEC
MFKKEIILIFILIGIALLRFFFFIPEKPDFDNVVGKEVYFMGEVVEPPDVRLNNQRITVKPNDHESNILVVAPRSFEVSYGDIVEVKGILETPENFITNVGKEFNYKRYLANQDIYYILQNASLLVISSGNGNKIKSILFKIRDSFMLNIEKIISPPRSGLANGLILGARGGFDEETREEFINTGTIHIVALSGYNVTIVAEGVMKILGLFLSQALSIFFGIFVIFLFIIMTGASSTAVRAGIMATILLFARLTGRNYDAGRALVIAGLLMITYDLRTITDISFQLSFLATGGILFLTPKVILWLKYIPIRFKIRELVATTISATISVLPILLYITGIFSVVSIPANILILPIIPFAMLFSFLTGILGFISANLSLPFGYISHLLLSYILSIIHFFASLPFASVHTKTFPLVLVILIYIYLIWWVFKKKT